MDVRSYTANKIKEYRKLKRMTQKELGAKIGVKHNTVSGYENGTNEPEQDLLFRIANALEISINDLFPETTSQSCDLKDFLQSVSYCTYDGKPIKKELLERLIQAALDSES